MEKTLWDTEVAKKLTRSFKEANVSKSDLIGRLVAIELAWEKYNEITGDYYYHLEEGGDSEYESKDVSESWKKLNELIKGGN